MDLIDQAVALRRSDGRVPITLWIKTENLLNLFGARMDVGEIQLMRDDDGFRLTGTRLFDPAKFPRRK
jgi:hypothetical protein